VSTIEKALAKKKQTELDKKNIETKTTSISKKSHDKPLLDVDNVTIQFESKAQETIVLNAERLNEKGFIYSPESY